jgi:hypothetical protein
MPRKMRVEYPGAIYHVMSRGDRREDIFLDDVDRQDFLKTLAEACHKATWEVHAYSTALTALRAKMNCQLIGLTPAMLWPTETRSRRSVQPVFGTKYVITQSHQRSSFLVFCNCFSRIGRSTSSST